MYELANRATVVTDSYSNEFLSSLLIKSKNGRKYRSNTNKDSNSGLLGTVISQRNEIVKLQE